MPDKYIEIKGPFQIRNIEAGQKISTEIKRLAKEHPQAKFILREKSRVRGSGSVYSATFDTLAQNKMGTRIRVVKSDYRKGKNFTSKVRADIREKEIAKLKPFKTVEFTFSGEVASPEWKAWRAVDIALSKEKAFDPLRSKGQHFASFEGYQPEVYHVKKYPGGKGQSSASKRIDALIDRVSEYGRKKGAKRASVDAGIQYIRDKADAFEEDQRVKMKRRDPLPINMLSKDRRLRLDRLQKNYGTPPLLTGKVNLVPGGEKKIKPQVPISATIPTFEKKEVTTHLFTTRKHAAHTPTGKKETYFTDASVKDPFGPPTKPSRKGLKGGIKAGLVVDNSGIKGESKEFRLNLPKGSTVVKTKHEQIIKGVQTIQTGTEKLPKVESKSTPWADKGKPKLDLAPEKKGQINTGLIEGGDTTPVGITLREDTARQFDETGIQAKPGSPEAELFPEQSSERVHFENKPFQREGNPNVNYDVWPHKEEKAVSLKGTVVKHPAQTSAKNFDPKNRKYSQFPGLNVTALREVVTGVKSTILHPFSKMKSGLTSWDKLNPQEFGDKEIFASPTEDIKKGDFDVDLGEDRKSGSNVAIDTGEHLEKEAKKLSDELARPSKTGVLPPSALENKPWLKFNVGATTTVSDVLYGDSADYDEAGHRKTSTTSLDVKEPIRGQVHGDPTYQGRKKPLTKEQQLRSDQLKVSEAKGDTTKVVTETKKNKYGMPYQSESLITKYSSNVPIQEQLDKENVFRKRRGGKSKQEVAKDEFRRKSTEAIKSGDLVFKGETPGKEVTFVTGTGEHGSMITRTSTKPKPKLTGMQLLKKGAPTAKAVLPFGLGLGLLGLTPYLAEASLSDKGIKNPDAEERIRENIAVFLGAPGVYSGVGEKPGYLQNLGKYDITALRESGKRRKSGSIKGAGGKDTPYSKIKAWMFSKPKTTLPYKSDMETKSNRAY